MINTTHILILFSMSASVLMPCTGRAGDSLSSLVTPGATVTKLADGFRFTEGPVPDINGDVLFTDIPNLKIHKWKMSGKLSTYMDDSLGANGLAFDKDGNLVLCGHNVGRKLMAIGPDGNMKVLADSYNGKMLNSPNDLWIDPEGGIYFTDPRYGNRDNMVQDGEHVYYLSPDGTTLKRVIDDMVRPNGLIGSPDGTTLYVADAGAGNTFEYRILEDGSLADKERFATNGSDGVTMDEHGNIYLTTDAVLIYSPEGKLLEKIAVPKPPSNVCFAGKDRKTLFITARDAVYSIKMAVRGMY